MINDFFNILLPQACLGLFIIIQLILGMIVSPRYSRFARIISAVGIALSTLLLTTVQTEPQYFGLRNSIMSDSYSLLFHFIILLCVFFVVLLTRNLTNRLKQHAYTLQAILLTAILGAMNTISANDFLTMFISIELLSFPTYFLIACEKGYKSKEASFKYLITSAVSTGIFLFGVSYLYGITGSINIEEIYEIVVESNPSLIYSFACIMIVLGLIAKLAVLPFANWIIDVYKGCETSILAFLSTIPKIALFGILCRLLVFPLENTFELAFIIGVLALITGLWANTFAIRERNLKVIFACSSAANASYILLAAGLVSVYNLSTVIFYLICYVLMNITVFTYLNIAEANNIWMEADSFKGLFHKNNWLTLSYTIAVLGLAGLPITSGFIAKIYLFSAIAHSGLVFIPFLIILLILTVIALFYYLKIIFPLFSDYDKNEPREFKALYSQKFIIAITTLATILIGIYPEKLVELCKFIAYNI